MARRQRGKLDAPTEEEWVSGNQKRVRFVVRECREGVLDLAAVARPNQSACTPTLEAVFVTSLSQLSLTGFFGLTSTPTRAAEGRSSRSNPNCFVPSSALKKFTPVALPSGRLRLATRPSLTGSSLTLFASAAGSADINPIGTGERLCKRGCYNRAAHYRRRYG